MRLSAVGLCAALLTGCGNAPASGSDRAASPDQPLVQAATATAADQAGSPTTGAPAQPLPDAGDISPASRVISKEEMAQKFPDRGTGPGCFITFAYAGYAPETLIWDGEPCSALSAQFLSPAELKKYNDWDSLDATDQEKVMALPEQRVLYVGGAFTASVYPLDVNNLTYEIAVSD